VGHHLAGRPEIFGLLLALARFQPVSNRSPPKGGGEQRFKRFAIGVQFTAEPQFDQHAPFRVCVERLRSSGIFFGQEIQGPTPFI